MHFPFYIALIFVGIFCNAQTNPVNRMNDIAFSEYGDFTKTWKLVTVRYRQDTHEMRFTYANEKAWESLSKGIMNYPDGSVFAKIGFKSSVDPAFNSSIVPSGARRFQYMVKNSEKYKDTDGWGYAVFTSEGGFFEGDHKTVTQSCHACHKVVPERGFVFSEALEFSPFVKNIQKTYDLQKNMNHIVFEAIASSSFKEKLKLSQKKMGLKKVYVIAGDLRDYFFGGTLDEVTPLLINYVIKNNSAAGFVSRDQKTFKILKMNKKSSCDANSLGFISYENRAEWVDEKFAKENVFCYSKSNL